MYRRHKQKHEPLTNCLLNIGHVTVIYSNKIAMQNSKYQTSKSFPNNSVQQILQTDVVLYQQVSIYRIPEITCTIPGYEIRLGSTISENQFRTFCTSFVKSIRFPSIPERSVIFGWLFRGRGGGWAPIYTFPIQEYGFDRF